jgi:hypothetical protein
MAQARCIGNEAADVQNAKPGTPRQVAITGNYARLRSKSMPKETILMTRDLFDEMIQAATDKERNRIIHLLEEESAEIPGIQYLVAIIRGDTIG